MFGLARKYQIGGQMPAQSQVAQDQGLDFEGQLQDGVSAFMESQDPAIAIEVVTMLAQMMGIAPEIDPYQGGEALQNQPAGEYPGKQQAVTQVPMGRNGMKIYKAGGKIDPSKKKPTKPPVEQPIQPVIPPATPAANFGLQPVLPSTNLDGLPPPVDFTSVGTGSGAKFNRLPDGSMQRIQKADYAGISNKTLTQDRLTAANTGNGFFSGIVGPGVGGVSPNDLIGVGGPRTGKRIVYTKKKS